nr:phosphatidylinositol 3,4,5-trisphosphate 3-phosphatase and protein-tyrosine-phosphatase PTEN2A [Ipomoea batatas]
MDTQLSNASNPQPSVTANMETSNVNSVPAQDGPSKLSTWAKSLKIPQPFTGSQEEENSGNAAKSTFARFTSGFGMLSSPKSPTDDNSEGTSTTPQSSFIGTFTKGLVDSSKNAVKAVSVKARHVVSQNKRRYQDKYKVYNLCSERLYDVSLFEGKVASFPFDDHNCPPIQLIMSFCQSAYSWLKEDIENVVVVHCKAGMARTGLMISSLLLYLKFFPTAEESINYYNQKSWLNTTMIENRKILNTSDLDGFDKRKLPSPGFQVEIVLVDYDTAFPTRPQPEVAVSSQSTDNSSTNPASGPSPHSADEPADANSNQKSGSSEKDDVFSDNEAEETGKPKVGKVTVASEGVQAKVSTSGNNAGSTQISSLTQKTQQVSLGDSGLKHSEQKRDTTVGAASVPEVSNTEVSDFKIMAADASVFTFGDEEDYESE